MGRGAAQLSAGQPAPAHTAADLAALAGPRCGLHRTGSAVPGPAGSPATAYQPPDSAAAMGAGGEPADGAVAGEPAGRGRPDGTAVASRRTGAVGAERSAAAGGGQLCRAGSEPGRAGSIAGAGQSGATDA